MTKVILSGCNGKMGRFVTDCIDGRDDVTIVAGVDVFTGKENAYPVYGSFGDIKETADVVIDFSNPSVLDGMLSYCTANGTALVACTTGYSDEQVATLKAASKTVPVFFSGNMSIGVNLLIELAKTATKVLGDSFDIEIIEAHHNQKIDAPSGTAMMIANAINETLDNQMDYVYDRQSVRKKREKNEIGMHAIRGGTIVGEHQVIFAGKDEIVTLSHSARSRALFSTGAVNAALYIAGKEPGMYSMSDMLK